RVVVAVHHMWDAPVAQFNGQSLSFDLIFNDGDFFPRCFSLRFGSSADEVRSTTPAAAGCLIVILQSAIGAFLHDVTSKPNRRKTIAFALPPPPPAVNHSAAAASGAVCPWAFRDACENLTSAPAEIVAPGAARGAPLRTPTRGARATRSTKRKAPKSALSPQAANTAPAGHTSPQEKSAIS